MKLSHVLIRCAVFATLVLSPALPCYSAAAGKPKEETLIDFTEVTKDPDGKVSRSFEYAYGDWEKHIIDLRGRGTLIQAGSGKGGLGENKTLVPFAKFPVVDLQFVIGNANRTGAMVFSVEDNDGTQQAWTIPLAGKPSGQPLRHRLDLTKSDREDQAGKTPGMNFKKIRTWQVKGDWSDSKVEVLLIKLTAEK